MKRDWRGAAWGVVAALTVLAGCQSDPPRPPAPRAAGATTPGAAVPRAAGGAAAGAVATAPSRLPTGPAAGTASATEALSAIPRGTIRGITGEPEIRVRLVAEARSATISNDERLVFAAALAGGTGSGPLSAPVTVGLSGGAWTITDGAGRLTRFPGGGELVLGATPAAVTPGATTPATGREVLMAVNGRRFPGTIRLLPRGTGGGSSGAFDVIEEVNLERYLQGVVAAEMFKNWPINAYRVQAVAARSYALHERARARARGDRFDVESSVQDQAYDGASANAPAAQAVVDTRGVVLTFGGDILRAYFSSTCGGRPASARDTWPVNSGFEYNLSPALQSQPRAHACQGATYYRWSVARTRSELARRFRAWGAANGHPLRAFTTLADISVIGTNAAGRPSRFRVTQRGGGTYDLTGEEFRRACNQPVEGLAPITSANRVHSSDLSAVLHGETVAIAGQGFGHGVGMCQWCAKGFADQGESWEQTVGRFYPGARLERGY